MESFDNVQKKEAKQLSTIYAVTQVPED
jgi:hypothetical protein